MQFLGLVARTFFGVGRTSGNDVSSVCDVCGEPNEEEATRARCLANNINAMPRGNMELGPSTRRVANRAEQRQTRQWNVARAKPYDQARELTRKLCYLLVLLMVCCVMCSIGMR